MADKPDAPTTVPGVKISSSTSERAPFIYFDGVLCMGTHNGASGKDIVGLGVLERLQPFRGSFSGRRREEFGLRKVR